MGGAGEINSQVAGEDTLLLSGGGWWEGGHWPLPGDVPHTLPFLSQHLTGQGGLSVHRDRHTLRVSMDKGSWTM